MNPKLIALSALFIASVAHAGDDGVIQAPRGCADLSGQYEGMGCEGTLRQRAAFELVQLGCQTLILNDQGPSIPMVFHLSATENQEIVFDPNTHTAQAKVKMRREARWADAEKTRLRLQIEATEQVTPVGGAPETSTSLTVLVLSRDAAGNLRVEGDQVEVSRGRRPSTEQGVCTYRRR